MKNTPAPNGLLTQSRLHELFSYDPGTGEFTRKVQTTPSTQIGQVAGCRMKLGYVSIGVDAKRYLAHRLAWLFVYGKWPDKHIDHIDGNTSNNRLNNLRDVSVVVNAQNRTRCNKQRRSGSGLLGAHRHFDGSWRARIRVNGKTVHIGLYKTPQEAHEAYLAYKRIHHAGCTL